MTDFTRPTVIGVAHRPDLVVPNEEAVSSLLPG
jgi:hypothetical protein